MLIPSVAPDMPRSPYQKRTLIVDCSVCHRWSSVPDLQTQAICREAGVCLSCMRNDYHMLKVRIVAIELAMESIARRGTKAPEEQRPILRTVYAKKARQLTAARVQLADLEGRSG